MTENNTATVNTWKRTVSTKDFSNFADGLKNNDVKLSSYTTPSEQTMVSILSAYKRHLIQQQDGETIAKLGLDNIS